MSQDIAPMSEDQTVGLVLPQQMDLGASSSSVVPLTDGVVGVVVMGRGEGQPEADNSENSRREGQLNAPTNREENGRVPRSKFRGVSFDRKKQKWRAQIKVASLGKSGVSVGYYDSEEAAARAYDRAAIMLLGSARCGTILNFPLSLYDGEDVPNLCGRSREEVKATLKSERLKLMPRRRNHRRRRTSKYLGVGCNRKSQWQARILFKGKVTHLGYYGTEEDAARVYDRVCIGIHGKDAETNFPISEYAGEMQQFSKDMSREDLQRMLGVKPMDKSSKYRGVSKKKERWEAKVMVKRKWAYRELFDTEEEAARAYDKAVWRLKPREAKSYVNFKESVPPEVADMLASERNRNEPGFSGGQEGANVISSHGTGGRVQTSQDDQRLGTLPGSSHTVPRGQQSLPTVAYTSPYTVGTGHRGYLDSGRHTNSHIQPDNEALVAPVVLTMDNPVAQGNVETEGLVLMLQDSFERAPMGGSNSVSNPVYLGIDSTHTIVAQNIEPIPIGNNNIYVSNFGNSVDYQPMQILDPLPPSVTNSIRLMQAFGSSGTVQLSPAINRGSIGSL